ncbi:MAG: tyrosine-type recombinase/integrase [Anaerolineales bacterium]|nr:tyrosine-type recombinase/integrase [Anaerolineales bacterium]
MKDRTGSRTVSGRIIPTSTCATMLLNAGMSILGVQKLLGHKYVETTLRYARVYDSTVEKDFLNANWIRL